MEFQFRDEIFECLSHFLFGRYEYVAYKVLYYACRYGRNVHMNYVYSKNSSQKLAMPG